MATKIKGIFFDFGGTLYDYTPSTSEVWATIAQRLGVAISPDDIRIRRGMKRQNQEFEKLGKPFHHLSSDELHSLNCIVLKAIGIGGEDAKEIIDTEFTKRERGKMFRLQSDAKATLKQIKQLAIKIGLLSNVGTRLAKTRRPTMEKNGILKYFDVIILSVEVGTWKPEKKIFDIALREIGVSNPAEAMHVGDNPVMDIKGARKAGLIPVLFDPLDVYSLEDVIKIKTLSDILQWLV